MIFFQIFDFYGFNNLVIFIIRIFQQFNFLFNLVILRLLVCYSSNTFFVTLLSYSSNIFSVTLLKVSSNAFCYSATTLSATQTKSQTTVIDFLNKPYDNKFKNAHHLSLILTPLSIYRFKKNSGTFESFPRVFSSKQTIYHNKLF